MHKSLFWCRKCYNFNLGNNIASTESKTRHNDKINVFKTLLSKFDNRIIFEIIFFEGEVKQDVFD